MTRKKVKPESQWIREIAYVMLKNKGPFTRLMLATELQLIHPDRSIHELKNEISLAMLDDRLYNEPRRFKLHSQGWYDLVERDIAP